MFPNRNAVVSLLILAAVHAAQAGDEPDPRKGAVPLPAQGGWRAHLAIDRGEVGVWTVKSYPIIDAVGSDEVVALDDEGRLTVLIPYSGRWTPIECLNEGAWLGGLAHGDLDPDQKGAELYTGGKRGNLWQVIFHSHGALETRLVAHLEGREIHTIVLGDLMPAREGREMAVFTWPGGLYLVTSGMQMQELQDLDARIRDAVLLPAAGGAAPEIATVSRGGRLSLLKLGPKGPQWTEIHRVKSGMGRVALRSPAAGQPTVLYAVCDDGRVLRFERRADRGWKHELIYNGPLGMRGVVAGAFDANPAKETIAVFGYGKKVELLAREKDGWTATTIFTDRGKGHWLATAEVDGRNSTPEIFVCGYGGRVVMLYRPPGYGRPGVPAHEEAPATAPETLRIGFGAIRRDEPTLTPLSYRGGFRSKTLVYETLVGTDEGGRAVPGLAESWERLDDGKRYLFTLPQNARFHDGSACDAPAVKSWFDRWLGKPEHDWLGMNGRVESVRALDARRLEFRLREPYPLERDLAAVNPCGIGAPSADPASSHFAPVGSGPYRVVEHDPMSATLLERVDGHHGKRSGPKRVEFRFLPGGDHVSRSHIRALELGEVDLIADGWAPQIPRDEARKLGGRKEFRLLSGPGSVTLLLGFGRDRKAFGTADARRRLAQAIDREELVRKAALGFAKPAKTLFSVPGWPKGRGASLPVESAGALRAELLVYQFDPDLVRAANALARQARRAAIDIDVVVAPRTVYLERLRGGEYDLVFSRTHGLPYDPHMWLVSRFLSKEASAAHPELARAVRASFTDDPKARAAAYRAVEAQIQKEVVVVPLYVPHRLAVMRRGIEGFRFGPSGYVMDLTGVKFSDGDE